MSWSTLSFWFAILLLVDASIGLWFSNHWQRVVPSINIRRIALVEAGAAMVILVAYFWLGR